ncbi:MAG: DUF5668 domain-containing protein [Chloroflexota bacterium]|nr:DUF5668 domain-containing protein [Chloroflexota bacterium]
MQAHGAGRDSGPGYRSLFWPVLLIGIGVIWLLASLNILSTDNLNVLFRLWPLALIVIGLDILIGRRSAALGATIAAAAVVLALALVVAGPSLGLAPKNEVVTENRQEPIGNATSGRIVLDLGAAPTTVNALTNTTNLVEGEFTHTGTLRWQVSGAEEKTVEVSQEDSGMRWPFFLTQGRNLRWTLGLTPRIPLSLTVDSGSGSANLNLGELNLREVTLDTGSGALNATLPASQERYAVRLSSGSGSVNVTIEEGADAAVQADTGSGSVNLTLGPNANVDATVSSGSGSVFVDVPDGAAVRVEVQSSGSGRVRVAPEIPQIQRGEDDEGVWETQGYSAADRKITIRVTDLGSGNLEIR